MRGAFSIVISVAEGQHAKHGGRPMRNTSAGPLHRCLASAYLVQTLAVFTAVLAVLSGALRLALPLWRHGAGGAGKRCSCDSHYMRQGDCEGSSGSVSVAGTLKTVQLLFAARCAECV